MAKHNERKLSLIWDKRQKDFVVKYPRRCDGALIVNTLLSDVLRWCLPDQADNKGYPYNWKKENLKEELEKRGYDLETIRFSIELKDKKTEQPED